MSRDPAAYSLGRSGGGMGRELGASPSHWRDSNRISSYCSDYSSLCSRRGSEDLGDGHEAFKVTLTEEAFAKQEVKPVLKSSRSQSLLSQLLDDDSSCLQSMSSSFRYSHAVRIFDLYEHMPNVDLSKLLVRDLITAVASLYEIRLDDNLALHVADELGFPTDDFPALTQTACVGTVGEDSFVLMQDEQRIAHVQIRSQARTTSRRPGPGESWKYAGDHYISPIRERYSPRREVSCSIGSEGWYSYKSHQCLTEDKLPQSHKQRYTLDGEVVQDSASMRRWRQQQSEDARTEPCTEDENDDADACSEGNGSDEEIFNLDDV